MRKYRVKVPKTANWEQKLWIPLPKSVKTALDGKKRLKPSKKGSRFDYWRRKAVECRINDILSVLRAEIRRRAFDAMVDAILNGSSENYRK